MSVVLKIEYIGDFVDIGLGLEDICLGAFCGVASFITCLDMLLWLVSFGNCVQALLLDVQ